jgi:hypothetical protein
VAFRKTRTIASAPPVRSLFIHLPSSIISASSRASARPLGQCYHRLRMSPGARLVSVGLNKGTLLCCGRKGTLDRQGSTGGRPALSNTQLIRMFLHEARITPAIER